MCLGCGTPLDNPLCLQAEDDRRFEFRLSLRVNQAWARGLGADSRLWDKVWQMEFVRKGREWYLVHNPSARNDTILNGHSVSKLERLRLGDVVAVGRANKRILLTRLTVVDPS